MIMGRILAGRALTERQCALKREAWYVNVWASVHWEEVYSVGESALEEKIFFNLLKLTNQKRPKITCTIHH